MKGAITLAIYIAIGCIPVVVGPAGGQLSFDPVKTIKTVPMPVTSSDHVKTATVSPPPAAKPAPIDRGWAPSVMPDAEEVVVIKYGQGGSLHEHMWRFSSYRNKKSKVEIRGPCYSACTMITVYVGKADLCIAEGAFLAFHAVRTRDTHKIMPAETGVMYYQQPEDIRAWIDRNGGWQKLPLDGYWTMYDRDLWAMGYPRCS